MTSELNSGVQSGNHLAFKQIFETYYRYLLFYINRIVQDEALSQDIAEETFVTLWEQREKMRDSEHTKAFLYRTARNRALNAIKAAQRAEKRHQTWTDQQPELEYGSLVEIIRTEFLRELHAEIDQLPTQCQKVIRMSFLEGLSNQEIAEQLNLSINTVKNQKQRGIALLRSRIDHPALVLLLAMLMR